MSVSSRSLMPDMLSRSCSMASWDSDAWSVSLATLLVSVDTTSARLLEVGGGNVEPDSLAGVEVGVGVASWGDTGLRVAFARVVFLMTVKESLAAAVAFSVAFRVRFEGAISEERERMLRGYSI